MNDQIQHINNPFSFFPQQNVPKTKKINNSILISKQNKNNTVNGVKMKSILTANNNAENSSKTVYLCSECNLGYNTIEDLRKHMVTVSSILNSL